MQAGTSVPLVAAFDEINITVAAGPAAAAAAAGGAGEDLDALFLDGDESEGISHVFWYERLQYASCRYLAARQRAKHCQPITSTAWLQMLV